MLEKLEMRSVSRKEERTSALYEDPMDAKGLIQESYRIEGIGIAECRSIFLDWAISVPVGIESGDWVRALLEKYRGQHPAHPMTQVLQEALVPAAKPSRRGGAQGRRT